MLRMGPAAHPVRPLPWPSTSLRRWIYAFDAVSTSGGSTEGKSKATTRRSKSMVRRAQRKRTPSMKRNQASPVHMRIRELACVASGCCADSKSLCTSASGIFTQRTVSCDGCILVDRLESFWPRAAKKRLIRIGQNIGTRCICGLPYTKVRVFE